jgi:hypothetical protein
MEITSFDPEALRELQVLEACRLFGPLLLQQESGGIEPIVAEPNVKPSPLPARTAEV